MVNCFLVFVTCAPCLPPTERLHARCAAPL